MNCGRPAVVTVDVTDDVAVVDWVLDAVEVIVDDADVEKDVVAVELPVVVPVDDTVEEAVDVAVEVCVVTSQLMRIPVAKSVRAVFNVATSFRHSVLQSFLHPDGAVM